MVYRTKNWTICLCFPENRENVETFFPSSRGKKKVRYLCVTLKSNIAIFSYKKIIIQWREQQRGTRKGSGRSERSKKEGKRKVRGVRWEEGEARSHEEGGRSKVHGASREE